MLILLYINPLYSQSFIDIKGKVSDSEEKTGLPYAHVFLEGTSLGVSSDIEGNFHVQVPLNYNKVDSLVISFVGYHTQKIALKSIRDRSNLEVYLKPYTEELTGVTISSNYTVIDLLKEALAKRKENYYEKKPVHLKGHYYENAYSQQKQTEVRKLEAYLTTYRPQINTHKLPSVAVDKARMSLEKGYRNFAISTIDGILGSLDDHNLVESLTTKSFKSPNKVYQMQGLRTVNNRLTYYVTVQTENPNIKALSEIYIDTTTLAFSKLTYQSVSKHRKVSAVGGNRTFYADYYVPRFQALITYTYHDSTQTWFLKKFDTHLVLMQREGKKDTIHLYTKYIVQDIKRKSLKSLNPTRCLSSSASFLGNYIQSFATRWNSSAWKEE